MYIALVILIFVVLAVALLLILASKKPDMFRVERTLAMKASPEKIYPYVNDFHTWAQWSPYENVPGDELKKEFKGPQGGVGAYYAWEGKKTGKGYMTTTESSPRKIVMDLHFDKPMKADNTAWLKFEPNAEMTTVTWAVEGKDTLMGKVFCMFFDRDNLVGKDFAKGLENLKTIVEK